ncbi:DUF2889 domain-containing protein [Pseudomonas sp. GD03860]|uniref:DUF2889 domain-containing protein n=1 Tax=Pseudomonas TaxID=286 RepID=UPI002363C443|nr:MULTISPECIES: DUF2889 domain-containing protein [Pseudomonas]MDD2058526.1 DUF2889 domain-containing protein [Pseudomonas putida]MDH0640658.1 DUF2889 domain-containing protein [Pseudomonas sp. GD03860]
MNQDESTAPTRRLLHTRQVTCTGYLRSDGLFDIEGRLLDTKGCDTEMPFGTIPAGGTLHQMYLLMTVDADLVIQHVEARSEVVPTPGCAQISQAYAALKGVKVGAGFKQRVAERVGGINGCTHLSELLGPMATTLIQTTAPILRERLLLREQQEPGFKRPKHWVIGTCHTYRNDGEVVRTLWPDYYEPGQNTGTDTNVPDASDLNHR